MPTIARGFVDQAELKKQVAKAAKALNPKEVRDVEFRIGSDWTGEAAIFFGILLTPYGAHDSRLADVTARVREELSERLQPYNRWGLQDYYDFTSDPVFYRDPNWM